MFLLTAVLAAGVAAAAGGASPVIRRITPPGLTVGEPVEVTIEGEGLEGARVILPVPLAGQRVMDASSPGQLRVELQVDEQVIPDLMPLAVATQQGVSDPVVVSVDALPQRPLGSEPVALPVAVYGELSGRKALAVPVRIEAKGGVWIEVEAQRIGSALRPDLRVLGPSGRQLAWSGPRSQWDGDARLYVEIPAAGVYQVELRDVAYRPMDRAPFRLKMGHHPAAEVTDPIAVTAGELTSVLMRGSSADGPTRSLLLLAQSIPGRRWMPVRDPVSPPVSGPAPKVFVSSWPEARERDQGDRPLVPPAAINGVIGEPGEVDRWPIQAASGQQLVVDILARQAGSPLDARLTLVDSQGNQLAQSDDSSASMDPRLEFEVPEGGMEVRVSDTQGHGGSEYVYRLVVWPQGELPDPVQWDVSRIEVPAGGRTVIPVRRGQTRGPLDIIAVGLPDGPRVEERTVSSGREGALMEINALQGKPGSAAFFRWMARRGGQYAPIRRADPERPVDGRLAEVYGIPVAITRPSPLRIRWADAEQPQALGKGRTVGLPLELEVDDGIAGTVRLTLLAASSRVEVEPKQPAPQEAAVLRVVDAAPVAVPGETRAELKVAVPAEFPGEREALAVLAELTAEGDPAVVARASTEIVVREVAPPLAVTIDSVLPLDGEGVYVVEGHIRRGPGVSGVVRVTVTGLGPESAVPSVRLPEGAETFRLVVTRAGDAPLQVRARRVEGGEAAGEQPLQAEVPVAFPVAP